MFRSMCSGSVCSRTPRNFTLNRPKIIPKSILSMVPSRNYSTPITNSSVPNSPVPVEITALPPPPMDLPPPMALSPPVDATLLTNSTAQSAPQGSVMQGLQDLLTVPFDYLHQWVGLPWWGTLFAVGIALRLLLAPLQVKQLRNSLKSSKLLLTIDKVQKEAIPIEPKEMDKVRFQILDLAKTNFRTIFQMSLIQMSAFFGVLRLSQVEPLKTQLSTGGYAWFTDLTVPDPTYRLALGASVFIMCSIYWPFLIHWRPPTRIIIFISLFVPVLGLAVSTQYPASWLVYMLGTAIYSFVATLVFSVPAIRKSLDLPPHFVEPELNIFDTSQHEILQDLKEHTNLPK